ncbi:MAG TPA: TM0106 family RecB-like putative nuclease [Candidatus Dormibacteraeota bacterium]
MTTRYDVSGVPLQGGYVAKQCPVRAQNEVMRPAEPVPPDPFTERLFAHGNSFEAEVVAEILAVHERAVSVEGIDAGALEAATISAVSAGRSPILNARIPSDLVHRRVGRPDLLVAATGGGYRAVDVKWHQSLLPSAGKPSELPGMCAGLGELAYEAARVDPDFAARKSQNDLLQLAHYQRMLEAAGAAAPGPRLGGVIGTERRVVWYDLDLPMWRTPSSTGRTKLRTTMERYDFEFDFRLDIVAAAQRHLVDPHTPLLVVPVRCSECPTCPWNDYCRPVLEAGWGDVSLLPNIGWAHWKIHRDHGVTNRAELAALDWETASAVAAGVDVTGLPTADEATTRYAGSGLTSLPKEIDLARAAVGPAPVYRRRGVERIAVPRADVEVDIDMENTEVGVYLWGCLLTDRATGDVFGSEYHPFVTWELLTPEREAANSVAFWLWLMGIRSAARARGLTFRAYCYNASAENQYLRRLALAAGLAADVESFIASDEWMDLLQVWDSQLITGGASGLKVVASLIGFRWAVDDPGGGMSMVRYDDAAAGDESARRWLLDYNRSDVEATRVLREWMSAAVVPSVEDVDVEMLVTTKTPPH